MPADTATASRPADLRASRRPGAASADAEHAELARRLEAHLLIARLVSR